jgi:hypothetical protein
MDVKAFIEFLEREIKNNKDDFISSMTELNISKRSFCNWILLYMSYMGYEDFEECKELYE